MVEHRGRCEGREGGAVGVAIRELVVAVEELAVGGELLKASQFDRLDRLLLYAGVLRGRRTVLT
jgi:hypothetical protein